MVSSDAVVDIFTMAVCYILLEWHKQNDSKKKMFWDYFPFLLPFSVSLPPLKRSL